MQTAFLDFVFSCSLPATPCCDAEHAPGKTSWSIVFLPRITHAPNVGEQIRNTAGEKAVNFRETHRMVWLQASRHAQEVLYNFIVSVLIRVLLKRYW